MKKSLFLLAGLLISCLMMAEMTPIYYEGFSRCIDEEDENYGYTGGNDGQWGGDIAKAQAIYQDAPEWTFTYCNGAYQCLKVGTSKYQGVATTPVIECSGEVDLSFRVAPWEGDSLFYFTLKGGITTDPMSYNLKKNRWTTIQVHVTDIKSSLQITFSATNKHRFFLDDVCVRPMDPSVGTIRVVEGVSLSFGLLGRSYKAQKQILHVEGLNLSQAGITASLEDGEPSLFQLSTSQQPAEGGEIEVTCKSGASVGGHGCFLYLRGKDAKTGEQVEKRVSIEMEVANLVLEGSGTKPDPYTCGDVILLAANEGTVWTGVYYWVTGYVLGGVKRYQDAYDGISLDDELSLVLAASPEEKDDSKYITVQISGNARAALNVKDNAYLVGQRIKVQGWLLNEKANPLYIGKPGVMNVRTDAQYVLPDQIETALEQRVNGKCENTKMIRDGHLYLMYKGTMYNVQGIRCR